MSASSISASSNTTQPGLPRAEAYLLLLLIQPSPLPQRPLSNVLMHRINDPHSNVLGEISTHTYCVIHDCMGWVWG